jgi:hypothetical protein
LRWLIDVSPIKKRWRAAEPRPPFFLFHEVLRVNVVEDNVEVNGQTIVPPVLCSSGRRVWGIVRAVTGWRAFSFASRGDLQSWLGGIHE